MPDAVALMQPASQRFVHRKPVRSLDALEASRRYLMRIHGRAAELARFDVQLKSAEGDGARISWYGVKGMNGFEAMQVLSEVTDGRFSYAVQVHATLGPEVIGISLKLEDCEIVLQKSEQGGLQFYFHDLLPAVLSGSETVFLGFHQIRNDGTMTFSFSDDRGEKFMNDINLRDVPVIYASDGKNGRRPAIGCGDHSSDSTKPAQQAEALSGEFRGDSGSVSPVSTAWEQPSFAAKPPSYFVQDILLQDAVVQMPADHLAAPALLHPLPFKNSSLAPLAKGWVQEGPASDYLVPYGDDAMQKARAMLDAHEAERQAKLLRKFYDELLRTWMLNQGANANAEAMKAQERERELRKAMKKLQKELNQTKRFLPPDARARLENSLEKIRKELEGLARRSKNEVLRKGGVKSWLKGVAG